MLTLSCFRDLKLLADYLPPRRAIDVEGKYRFSTFTKVWGVFLERGLLK